MEDRRALPHIHCPSLIIRAGAVSRVAGSSTERGTESLSSAVRLFNTFRKCIIWSESQREFSFPLSSSTSCCSPPLYFMLFSGFLNQRRWPRYPLTNNLSGQFSPSNFISSWLNPSFILLILLKLAFFIVLAWIAVYVQLWVTFLLIFPNFYFAIHFTHTCKKRKKRKNWLKL